MPFDENVQRDSPEKAVLGLDPAELPALTGRDSTGRRLDDADAGRDRLRRAVKISELPCALRMGNPWAFLKVGSLSSSNIA